MNRIRKAMALFLAAVMCIPALPATAVAQKPKEAADEVKYNTGSYEYRMTLEKDMEERLRDFSDKYGVSAMEPECYQGNKEAEAEAADLKHYAVYEPDGSYEIVVEENAFFPYEVQFSYGGETFCKWFMENGDSVTVGGHQFRVKSQADGKAVTKMSMAVGGDTIRVFPEAKVFENQEDSLTQGTSLLPLKEINLHVDLENYTPVELTKLTFADVFQGETQLPEDTSIMWKRLGNTSEDDYHIGSFQDYFDLYNNDLEMITGKPDQLAADNIRYIMRSVSKPASERWLLSDVYTRDDDRKEITSDCCYIDSFQPDGTVQKVLYVKFTGPKKDGEYLVNLRLNPQYFAFDALRFSDMKVYDGKCTENELGTEITGDIWGDGKEIPGRGYPVTMEDNRADRWITFVSYQDGRITGCLPVELRMVDEFYSGVEVKGLKKETENGDVFIGDYSSTVKDGVWEYTYELEEDPADGQYRLLFDYRRKSDGQTDNTSDEFQAYRGIYDSIQAAQDAGAENVKAALFGEGYRAVYSGEGIAFSVFIGPDNGQQIKKYYRVKIKEPDKDEKGSVEPDDLKAQDGSAISYTRRISGQQDGTQNYTYQLKKPHPIEEPYTLQFVYRKGGSRTEPGEDVMAFQGRYASCQEAQAAGAANIKNTLFADGYTADYSKGISFSIFIGPDSDADQKKYCFMVRTERYVNSGAYATFTGVLTADGTEVPSYILTPQLHDSYDGQNYTIFVSGKAGEPELPVDLSALALQYRIADGAKMYVNGVQEGNEQSRPIDFSDKSVQFTVASEDGKTQTNYYVRIFQTGSPQETARPAELYLTSLDHEKSQTKRGEIVESVREVFLDSWHNDRHDILVMNVGCTSMSALRAELKSDSIVMDDYWKLNGQYDLAGLTTVERTGQEGILPNLAKIRLKAKDGELDPKDYGDLGTLTFTSQEPSGQKTRMILKLTGVVGDPRMTTTKIKNPTKYVPYGILITNNNTYQWNHPQYTVIKGELPRGLELMPNGELYGVPMEAGKFEITVRMDNSNGLRADERTFQFEVLDNSDDNVANAEDAGYELEKKIRGIDDKTADGNYLIISKGVFDEYTDLYIDGKKLKLHDDYEAESGSTRITIIAKALPKSEGTHTLGVEFRKNKNQRVVKAAAQNYRVEKKQSNNRPVHGGGSSGGSSYGGSQADATPPKPAVKPSQKPDPAPTPAPSQKPDPVPEPKPAPVRKDLANAVDYTVKAGDTLKSIAKKFYGRSAKWQKIYEANKKRIPASKKLKKGMKLQIPALNYTVKKGDDIKSIASKYFGARSKWKIVYQVNKDVIPASLQLKAGTQLVLPVPVVCTVYTVRKGDNLGKIAQKYYGKTGKWKKIFEANRNKIYRSYRMKVGSQLHIPAMTCTAKKKDDLKSLAKKYYGSESKWRQIYEANRDVIPKSKKIKTGVTLVIPVPVDIS